MSFTNLSVAGVVAGALILALMLYLLQQLRSRYRLIYVSNTRFWRQAIQDAPVRTLRQKFRHLWAYLLSLLICWLLWLGFSHPQWRTTEKPAYAVLYLDGSAYTADDTAMKLLLDQVQTDLALLNQDQREVVWGGSYALTVLAAGEDAVLLKKRTEALTVAAIPAALTEFLRTTAQRFDAGNVVDVWIYGNAPLAEEQLNSLPAHLNVSRRFVLPISPLNQGITALGYGMAASGRADKVDVLVRAAARGSAMPEATELEFRIDGQLFAPTQIDNKGDGTLVLRDLPAQATDFSVKLNNQDVLTADNQSSIQLPDAPVVRVALSANLPATILAVVSADKGLIQTDVTQAEVVIRLQEEDFGTALPAMELSSAQHSEHAFEIGYLKSETTEPELHTAMLSLGLDQIDHLSLATALSKPISVQLFTADQPKLRIWQQLFEPGYNFTQSKAFPVVMSRSLRWLAGVKSWYPYVQAGKAVALNAGQWSLIPDDKYHFGYLGAVPYAAAAGSTQFSEQALKIALSNPELTMANEVPQVDTTAPQPKLWLAQDYFSLVLLCTLLLLLITEWWFYQRGLMP
jgi:hypothetical protein